MILKIAKKTYKVVAYDKKGRIASIEYAGKLTKFYGDGIIGRGPVNQWVARINNKMITGKMV